MNGQQTKRPVLRCVAAGMLGAMAGASCKAAASSIALLAKFSVHNTTISQGVSLLFYLGYVLVTSHTSSLQSSTESVVQFTWRSWIHYVAGMDGIPSLQAAVISSSTNSLTMVRLIVTRRYESERGGSVGVHCVAGV